jgi:hypothetical protein
MMGTDDGTIKEQKDVDVPLQDQKVIENTNKLVN